MEGLRSLPPRQVASIPQRPVYFVPPPALEVPPVSGGPLPGAQQGSPPMSSYDRAWAEWEHKKQLDAQARQESLRVVQRMGWGTPSAEASPPVLQAADLDPGLTRPRGIGFLTPEEARVVNPLRPTLQRIQAKLDRGQPLEDWELRLFFGRLEQTLSLSMLDDTSRQRALRTLEWAHSRLDELEVTRKDGYGHVVIGNHVYPASSEGLQAVARKNRKHFLSTGQHLPEGEASALPEWRVVRDAGLGEMVLNRNGTIQTVNQYDKFIAQLRNTAIKHDGVPLHAVTWLNRRQALLEELFQGRIFTEVEKQYPYAVERGRLVDEPNVRQMTAVANWILLGEKSSQWSDEQVELLETFLTQTNRAFPEEIQRKFKIARQLNESLLQNEKREQREAFKEATSQWLSKLPGQVRQMLPAETQRLVQLKGNIQGLPERNDAWALAEGMRVLIQANTHAGKVNEPQLLEDMKFFMIDQRYNFVGIPAKRLHNFVPSNAAYNLFGGHRIGAVGWKEAYWDKGQLFDKKDNLINQVHHFAAFFIIGLDSPKLANKEAEFLDGHDNPQDIALSDLAIELAQKVRKQAVDWQHLPEYTYRGLAEYSESQKN